MISNVANIAARWWFELLAPLFELRCCRLAADLDSISFSDWFGGGLVWSIAMVVNGDPLSHADFAESKVSQYPFFSHFKIL